MVIFKVRPQIEIQSTPCPELTQLLTLTGYSIFVVVVYLKPVDLQLYEDIFHHDCLTSVIAPLLIARCLYVMEIVYFPIMVYIVN